MLNQPKAHFDPPITFTHAQSHSGNRAGETVLGLSQGCWSGQRGTGRAGGPSCPCGGPQSTLVLPVLTPGLIPCMSVECVYPELAP